MSEAAPAVFLSYASEDAPTARSICEALRLAGLEVWFDQNELRGGDEWDAEIRRRIKACALFVPLISGNTEARLEGYFRLEWKLAIDRSHMISEGHPFLLPVALDEVSESSARVPDRFREIQWCRLSQSDDVKGLVDRTLRLLKAPHLEASAAAPAASQPSAPRVRTTKSSLAVLPFRNLDGDPRQDYFVDGLTDDLITDISRFTRMSVLARDKVFAVKGHSEDVIRVGRELGVDHVLEGSVRRSGDRVRLNAKLIDVKTGHNVWAQRFDRELEDLFEVQDEMTRAIVAELEVQILEGEQAKSWQRGTDNPSALDLFRRSRAAGVPMSLQGFREGLSYLQQAVAIDPRYARAWAGVAMLGTATLMYGLPSGQSEMLTMSGKAADEALALDPKLAEAWMAKGHHLLYEGKRAEAEEAARKSLVLSVDANIVRTGAARIYLFTGRTEAAIALAQEVARNKKSAISRHPLVVIGMGTLVLGRYDEAIAAVLAHVQALPFNPLTRLIRAAAYAGLGQETEAREEGSHFKRLVHEEPFTPMAKWMLPFLEQESRDRIVGLLRKAEVE